MPTNLTFAHNLVDLSRHGVIEASAGTGKTFTIERLIVRMLITAHPVHTQRLTRIDEILVVTFTEKATSELRDRVRENIREALSDCRDETARANLRHAYENFDLAQISTIHGFCQRMLREYAFENGEPFEQAVVDDGEVFQRALRQIQRSAWPKEYGDSLADLLALSDYPGSAYGVVSGWERTALTIAQSLRPTAGERIEPEPIDGFSFDNTMADVREELQGIAGSVGKIDSVDVTRSDLYVDYAAIKIHAGTRKSRLSKIIEPLLRGLSRLPQVEMTEVSTFLAVAAGVTGFDEAGFTLLQDDRKDGTVTLPRVDLDHLCNALDDLWETWGNLRHQLAAQTIVALQRDADALKREQAQISFDDMLTRLDAALQREPNALLDEMRRRFAYALVDEFQDTDPVQWRILERVFVERGTTGLYVIGDPKQAIYGFRGADVETYRTAKRRLLDEAGATLTPLDVNWRSTPELIDSLNHFFAESEWFEDGYHTVEPPPDEKRKTRLGQDASGLDAISVVAFPKPLSYDAKKKVNGSDERRAMARFIARETRRLLGGSDGSPLLMIDDGDGTRPLAPDDVCVLIRKRNDANDIERELTRLGVPHSFYKKAGLYESDEATHLSYALAAIVDPSDAAALKRALLTPLFGFSLEDLAAASELPPNHRARTLLQEWSLDAETGNWPQLFQSVLEDTNALTGADEESDDPERRVANYRHITQELQREAIEQRLDITQVVERLNRLRRRAIAMDRDEDLHPLETEKPKVQIMTMHAAKGLQFPVVFLAGGFTEGVVGRSYYKFHTPNEDGDSRVIYDLTRDAANKQSHKDEEDAETQRLYYVAMTRAMHKLYIPDSNATRKAPLSAILHPAIEQAWPDERDTEISRVNVDLESGRGRLASGDDLATARARVTPGQVIAGDAIEIDDDELAPPIHDFRSRRIIVESYSSIHRRLSDYGPGAHVAREFGEGLSPGKDKDEPASADIIAQSSGGLPRGALVGSLLHEVLEEIDWTAAKCGDWRALAHGDNDTSRLIANKMRTFRLRDRVIDDSPYGPDHTRLDEVARLAWMALNAPLAIDGGTHRLCDISRNDRIHELEFHLKTPVDTASDRLLFIDDEAPRPTTLDDGFLFGFIDLVFRIEGRYFLLDWKSNDLGEDYSRERLDAEMNANGYDIQYRLYSLALLKWLEGFGLGAESFGGVYYLFLRGLREGGGESGVFFNRSGDARQVTSDLASRLGQSITSHTAKGRA